MPKVNPEILKWARESAGLSEEEAVKKLGINDTKSMSAIMRLTGLESGESEPSRSLLTKMAKQYHRPLLTFYMNVPPKTGNRGEDFRTLPYSLDSRENALVDALIRDIKARQELVLAILQDDEESERLTFIGSTTIEKGKERAINIIISTIDFDLHMYRNQPSSREAFAYLRNCAESAGVFVLLIGNLGSWHSNIDLESFRGFALADDLAPFIVINDADNKAAWSFTLIHELAHLVLGRTGISNNLHEKRIEKFCNDVAAEILLPASEINELEVDSDLSFNSLKEEIGKFAREYNVSGSMVAYSLYRHEKIDYNLWKEMSDTFRKDFLDNKKAIREKARDKSGGPNFYIVRRQRIGEALINFVSSSLSMGDMTTTKASKVLGVSPYQVERLIRNKHVHKVGE